MRQAACLLASLSLFWGTALAQDLPGADTAGSDKRYLKQSIDVGGVERRYLVHEPAGWDHKQALPVLLFFHGGGGTAGGNDKLAHIVGFCDRNHILLVCPEGLKRHWNDGRKIKRVDNFDDVGFIDRMIVQITSRWHVDKSRIYATGISNGGFFSQYLAIMLPQKIAAVASVAATLSQDVYSSAKPTHAVPIMFILGTEDPLVPFQGGEIKIGPIHRGKVVSAVDAVSFWVRVNGCQATPVITELPRVARRDPTAVAREEYKPDKTSADVLLYVVTGGGHTWPGGLQYLPVRIVGRTSRQIDANQLIWQFFQQHRLTN
jgi:polyhydroxybutyrate depolymerase